MPAVGLRQLLLGCLVPTLIFSAPRLTAIQRLTTGFSSKTFICPCFSPDGKEIVFNGRRDARGDAPDRLWRIAVPLDGPAGTPESIPAVKGSISYPGWRADGARICYNRGTALYEYDLTTGRTHLITDNTVADRASPAYAHRSNDILYRRDNGLWRYQRDRDTSVQLTSVATDRQPACSPDDEEIVLVSNDSAGIARIYLIRKDGTGRKLITPHQGSFSHPSWSPDGQSLIYHRTRGSTTNLCLLNRRTGIEARLTDIGSTGSSFPAEVVAAEFASFASTPNSAAIVFVGRTASTQDIYLARLSTDSSAPSTAPPLNKSPTVSPPDSIAPVRADSLASLPCSDTIVLPDSGAARADYRIVIFAADISEARRVLASLRNAGFTNAGNYVTGNPTPDFQLKYNDVPEEILTAVRRPIETYYSLKFKLLASPQLPSRNIYINLP